MFDLVSTSLFGTADSAMASVSTPEFLMCCAASIVLGAACAAIYMFRHNYSKNFVVTLALLPLIVQMVITLVNGNLGAGIAVMGFIGLAVLFTIIVAIVNVVYVCTPFGKPAEPGKRLCVSVPEDLEFDGMFDSVLGRFTESYELVEIRTTNMGSLYQLEYEIRMRKPGLEKRMIDEMRTMNGNLKITLGRAPMAKEVL